MGNKLRSLQDTFLYKMYNETVHLDSKLSQLYKNGTVVNSHIENYYIGDIQRRYKVPLKEEVVEEFKNGNIICMYNADGAKVPSSIPTFLINSGSGVRAVINLSNNASMSKDGELTISSSILYVLMESGLIHIKCFESFNQVKNNPRLIKSASESYALLFTKVINRMFTLGISEARIDTVKFLSGLFFITNVMSRDDSPSIHEMNYKYAMDMTNIRNRRIVESEFMKFNVDEDFKNIDVFVASLRKNVPGLEKLYLKDLVNQWMLSYGISFLMGLEHLPLFLTNIASVAFGSYLNNEDAIEQTVGAANMATILKSIKDI